MIRGLAISGMVIAAAMEPIGADPDLVRYAITQGGLLAVVLVLLWMMRSQDKQRLADERARTATAGMTIDALTALVGQTSAMMQKSISTGEAQEKAIHRLSRALEERRGGDRREEHH